MEQNKWFRVFGQCSRCGQKFKTKTMVSCQECKITKYCSNVCMGMDKDFHKNLCGNITTVPEVTKYGSQFYTLASNESKTHENIERWTEFLTGLHVIGAKKLSDEAVGERDTTKEAIAERGMTEEVIVETETTKESICTFCKNVSPQLLACSKCSNVKYCNKECQKRDFKRHKLLCFPSMKFEIINGSKRLKKSPEDNAVEVKATCVHCYCIKPITKMILCDSCCIPYCSQGCQRKNNSVHYDSCETLSLFHKVYEFIAEQVPPANLQKYGFPLQRFPQIFLLQIFDEAIKSLDPLALLQIISWYPRLLPPTAVVRDGIKNPTHVIFHDAKTMANITIKHKDKSAELKMSPLVECLKPGNFILLTKVLWHHCKDGTQRLIVGDLDTVHFIHLE